MDSKNEIKRRKKSKGFCRYSWMVESIINYGDIKTKAQTKKEKDSQNAM